MKKTVIWASLCLLLGIGLAACGGAKGGELLPGAAQLADKMIPADYDHNVEVNGAGDGIDVTIRLSDSLVNVEQIAPELFDALAALTLKQCVPAQVDSLARTLHKAKADVTVQLIGTDKASAEYTLAAAKLTRLQGAKLTQLNPALLKAQIIDIAGNFSPATPLNTGAMGVETTIAKGFLEYNVMWASAKSYAEREQGWLTLNYFNPLKEIYQQLNDACPGLFAMLSELGIDGVRMVYSASDSDRELRQAFPWRELEKPIEEYPAAKTK